MFEPRGAMTSDRRRFKRYPKMADFMLRINGNFFKAKMLDYSLSGVGAFVEGTLFMKKGDLVSLISEESAIGTEGEIVWTDHRKTGIRVGVKITGALKGLLSDFKLADILIGLQRSYKTGILTVESSHIVKRVYVKNGDMIFAVSNQVEDRLGNLLLREGRITEKQSDHAVEELQKTRQRYGAVLVRLGYLNPQELVKVVRHQVEEVILSLFGLERGVFGFEEKPLPTEEIITLKLSAANIIYYGTKKLHGSQFHENSLPPLDAVLCFSSDPLDLFQDIVLDESGKKVTSCIDGKTSIKDIISLTQIGHLEALKTICALLDVGMVKMDCKEGQSGEVREDIGDRIISEGVMTEIMEEKEVQIDSEIKDMIEDMYDKYEGLGYYGVLGVKQHSPLKEIKSAYYKVAKMFHPDMHFHLNDASLKNKLSDIFSYIHTAYTTLSNEQKRAEYDKLSTTTPSWTTSNREQARSLFEEGRNKLRKNEFSDAELLFGQAIYFDDTIAEYHYYYGLVMFKQNRFADAEKSYAKALNLEPQNASYLAELGFVFLSLGFPRRAKGFFERVLKILPDNVRAFEGLEQVRRSL